MKSLKKNSIKRLKNAVSNSSTITFEQHLNNTEKITKCVTENADTVKQERALRKFAAQENAVNSAFQNNNDNVINEIERSVAEMAAGKTITTKTIVKCGGRVTEKTTVKQLPPNVAAAKFLLTNKRGTVYKQNPDNGSDSGDGVINELLGAFKNV